MDTHEHLPSEAEWLSVEPSRLDFSQLMHYVDLDVVSAGLPLDRMNWIRFSADSADEKWAEFESFWEKTRNTAFAKVVDAAVADFYGLPGLNRDTYRDIGRKIRETRVPGRYRQILKDTAKIAVAVLDTGDLNPDREFFVPTVRLDEWMLLGSRADLQKLEKARNLSIGSLDDLARELEKAFQAAVEAGAVAIKTAQAYCRSLQYDYRSEGEASRAFDRVFGRDEPPDAPDVKAVSDYLFHELARLCAERDLPIQVHTGIPAGPVPVARSNPVLLADVFVRHPGARFDLLHAGYPYWEEMGALAKGFPNVRADLCWTHIISPAAARRALDEWLEVAPASKIFAFGGDLGSPEIAAAHLKLARQNVARVLADKVADGYFSLFEAKRVAEMIFRDNAAEFFGLG